VDKEKHMRRLLLLGLLLGLGLGGLGCDKKEEHGPTSAVPPRPRLQKPGEGPGAQQPQP
jgi:hypothetical protein